VKGYKFTQRDPGTIQSTVEVQLTLMTSTIIAADLSPNEKIQDFGDEVITNLDWAALTGCLGPVDANLA